MFRLYKAELKKFFLRPSIFVVTGLIILLLALSTFFYQPNAKNDFNVIYNQSSVGAIFNQFDNGTLPYDKATLQAKLNSAEEYIEFYQEDYDALASLKNQVEVIKQSYEKYESAYYIYLSAVENEHTSVSVSTYKSNLQSARTTFRASVNNFKDYFNDQIQSDFITILSTSNQNYAINTLVDKVGNYYDGTYANLDEIAKDGAVLKQLDDINFNNDLATKVNGLKPFKVDKNVLSPLSSTIVTARERLGNTNEGYYSVIYKYNSTKSGSSDVADLKTIKSYIVDYNLTVDYAYNIVVNSIKIDGLKDYGAININQFYSFENANLYEMQESLARTKYLFANDDFNYNYADVFSISQPSNENINAFDYSYYALRLCALFITIYIVVVAAGTIAGEQSNGTLKLLAIRPYKRSKILTGKILATLTIGAILLAVCSVATLVIGGINYGFASANVLVVFNATSAGAMNAFLLYVVAIITMLIEISFYALLSIFISTVFKSNIGAVAVSILVFFLSLILNIVAVNVPFIGFLPFTSINLFKYLGASFIGNNSASSILQGILTPTVFTGASFWISLCILAVTEVVICYVTYLLFNRRDIK